MDRRSCFLTDTMRVNRTTALGNPQYPHHLKTDYQL